MHHSLDIHLSLRNSVRLEAHPSEATWVGKSCLQGLSEGVIVSRRDQPAILRSDHVSLSPIAFSHQVQLEDVAISNSVQKGLRSGLVEHGRLLGDAERLIAVGEGPAAHAFKTLTQRRQALAQLEEQE